MQFRVKKYVLSFHISGQSNVNIFLETLKKLNPRIDVKFCFANEFHLGFFFKLKEGLPDELHSHIIYKYFFNICQANIMRARLSRQIIF